MLNVHVSTEMICVRGSKDEILLEAPLLDVYYTIAYGGSGEEGLPPKQFAQKAADALNKEYGCDLKWFQAANILDQVTEQMEESKKNTTSTPE